MKRVITTEEALLKSGFSPDELQKIKNNIERYGGALGDVIQDLANRFKIFLWVFFCCFSYFLFLVYSKHDDFWYVFSGGTSLLIAVLIIGFLQPPVISYKSWRFCRKNK